MGALFSVVHDTIMEAKCSSDKHKEAFDKSWGSFDAAYQANTPRDTNFRRVQTSAIALLRDHSKEILDARKEQVPTTPIKPSTQTHSIADDAMEVDDTKKPSKSEDPKGELEDPKGDLELMYSGVAVFNERFRDWQMGIRTVSDPH
jgi:hypothetical protein